VLNCLSIPRNDNEFLWMTRGRFMPGQFSFGAELVLSYAEGVEKIDIWWDRVIKCLFLNIFRLNYFRF
jgi:hypothetical protein